MTNRTLWGIFTFALALAVCAGCDNGGQLLSNLLPTDGAKGGGNVPGNANNDGPSDAPKGTRPDDNQNDDGTTTTDDGGTPNDGTQPPGEPDNSDNLGDGEFAGNAQSLAPYRNNLTDAEALHLLRRAAFGAKSSEIAEVRNLGLTAAVENLVTIKPQPDAATSIAHQYGDAPAKRWLAYMIEGVNPLQERVALFWHDRFATSSRVVGGPDTVLGIQHLEMLRSHALGNYRDFLIALTTDPLMLAWLNGKDSTMAHPNENYAREFWELFTLGRNVVYTENDIKASARALTGLEWYWPTGGPHVFMNVILHHDSSLKSIFPSRAAPANFNYLTMIDLTLAQPEAARYVARNLFVCFVHDHPSPAVVQQLADVFTAGNLEIAPVIRTLLQSRAFFSTEAVGNQVTSPVEHFVGVSRTLDMHIASQDSAIGWMTYIANKLAESGQELLNPPGVEGWSEDLAWMNDQSFLARARAFGYPMEYGPDRTPELPYHLLPPKSRWNQRGIVDEIVDSIAAAYHLPLTPEEHALYVTVLTQDGHVQFELLPPTTQPQHVRELIRLMAMDERVIGR